MHKNKIISIVAVIIAIIIGITLISSSKVEDSESNQAIFAVKRGPLQISVIESGDIKASEQTVLKSEVEGRVAIIYLIPEGTKVKEGELLVELDSSGLIDRKVDQEIMVQNAEASFVSAQENLAVTENQAKSDTEQAELNLDFAQQDLEKYVEGEYPNQIKEAEADITLAKEELSRAEETLKWSQKLYDEKYISQTELLADELTKKRKELNLKLAENRLDLLVNYTYKRQLAQLESDVRQSGMALDRKKRKATADIAQANANLKAKEAEFKRQKSKLEKIVDQISKTKIYAPADGLVIYATSAQNSRWGNNEPLSEGREVREREELIYLPTGNQSVADIKLHESNLDKITPGMKTIITVDAIPGSSFTGTVKSIAPLPDGQMRWLNPDLKVYKTEVLIDKNETSLKTGMSCKAEIIVDEYHDTLFAPIQCVVKIDGKSNVYKKKGRNFVPIQVETGLDNSRMIRIISGIEEGEEILLAPPLKNTQAKEILLMTKQDPNKRGRPSEGESKRNVPAKKQ